MSNPQVEAQIQADIEKVKRRQESEQIKEEDARKTEEFREMAREAKKRSSEEKERERRLSEAKTMDERIKARSEMDKARREENARIEAANQPRRATGRTPITPSSIKESIKQAVTKKELSRRASRITESAFGYLGEKTTGAVMATTKMLAEPQKTPFKKAYTSETKELSATAKQFVKSQQAPSKKKTYVTPRVKPGGLAINPAFVDNLMGISGSSKTQPAQKKSISNVTSSLDRFARLI